MRYVVTLLVKPRRLPQKRHAVTVDVPPEVAADSARLMDALTHVPQYGMSAIESQIISQHAYSGYNAILWTRICIVRAL